MQRLQRRAKAHPQLVQKLGRQVVPVHVFLFERPDGLADVFRQRVGRCLMAGKEPIGLDVEDESFRCALHPQLRIALGGQGVIRAVDLYHRKLAGVH